MALKATIHKVTLHIADMNRHYYQTHPLTLAKHPSENDLRMLLRLVVFGLHAGEQLAFTKGISTADEPDLWEKSLSGEIIDWIDLGQPDSKRVRQACGKARHAWIYNYGNRQAGQWWLQHKEALARFSNLSITEIQYDAASELEEMVSKTMDIQCAIQGDHVLLSDGKQSVDINLRVRQSANK